ncbi:MAG TPA: cytochrome c3 family protein [Candidatus Eisenbacteria bacterium]|nr:cytochrome c3 family protein [Candidatus Eisenbacteria bacterium]
MRRALRRFTIRFAAAGAVLALAGVAAHPARAQAPGAHPEEAVPPARVAPAGVKPAKGSAMCGVCHSDIRVKYEKGIHKSEGVPCTSCHGGNAAALTVEGAHRDGFRGKPARRTIPALCASCHADVARMRFYNLPSDQYALYQLSHHGMKLAKGDESVAVCTDCHGVHEIRKPEDPKSQVFGRNIPGTCGKCHGDAAFRKRHGLKEDPVAEYKEGVHGKAYLSGEDPSAPDCTRCHGSHGATPPGVGDVEKVCGQCHLKTRNYFLASPHKEAMDAAGQPECAACHNSHKTTAVPPEQFASSCLECHDKGDKEYKVALALSRMKDDASAEIATAETWVAKAAAIPLYVDDYRSRLQDARTALLEAAPVTHSLDSTLVEPHTRKARSIAARVTSEVREKVSSRWWHKVGLALFWFYLLMTAAILMRARRRAAGRGQ